MNIATCVSDKQQELDLPTLRIDDSLKNIESVKTVTKSKKKSADKNGGTPMSQISGVKRPLCHANSFTGEKLPKYGVETRYEEELGQVS